MIERVSDIERKSSYGLVIGAVFGIVVGEALGDAGLALELSTLAGLVLGPVVTCARLDGPWRTRT